MKIFLIALFLSASSLLACQAGGEIKKATISIKGNCEMCKERIETALDRKGIRSATWDKETKQLQVAYRADQLSEADIQGFIAAAGHDTPTSKATDKTYAALPECCQYAR